MKKGFTLVELSIVLVIIGLLIGGILVGQSLIESAKINRLVSDLRQYEVAITQFKGKFKYYPGDTPYFTPPGNGDQILDFGANGATTCAAAPNATLNNDERNQVWAHLNQASMLKGNYQPYAPILCGGTHSDFHLYAGVVSPYTELSPGAASYYGVKKYPISVAKASASQNLSFFMYLEPITMLSLETKLGSTPYDSTGKQLGLANESGAAGNCLTAARGGSVISCADSTAVIARAYYYIPQN